MDLTAAIAPRSDQLNADDLIAGPMTVTIKEVRQGNAEQPVNVELIEFPGRPYKPSKSMLRVMVAAWTKEASTYGGRSLTLYRNPQTRFGKEVLGGIEISHMSHLDKPLTLMLTASKGKKKSFTVQPLAAPVQRNWLAEADKLTGNVDALRALYTEAQQNGADQQLLGYIQAAATTPTEGAE